MAIRLPSRVDDRREMDYRRRPEDVVEEQRVVMITGCGSGIGLALARELYGRGHDLIVTDVDEARLRSASRAHFPESQQVLLHTLDVRDAAAWEGLMARAVSRFGRLDVLLNVAGFLVARWCHETTVEDVGLTIDVNVKGVIFGTNAAARVMIERGAGHVINVASLAALVPVPGLSVYSASKHAVRAFSIAAAEELRTHGVFVTVVCPGLVRTAMMDVQLHRPEAALTFSAPRPLEPEEVVTAILDRAMVHRPRELTITVPRSGQAPMARLVGAMPELATWLQPIITRLGRHNQRRLREP